MGNWNVLERSFLLPLSKRDVRREYPPELGSEAFFSLHHYTRTRSLPFRRLFCHAQGHEGPAEPRRPRTATQNPDGHAEPRTATQNSDGHAEPGRPRRTRTAMRTSDGHAEL